METELLRVRIMREPTPITGGEAAGLKNGNTIPVKGKS